MPENDVARGFHAQDALQRKRRDAMLLPIYDKRFSNYVLLDDFETPFVRNLQLAHIDTIATQAGRTITIDEKIVTDKSGYDAFFLETKSYDRAGWLEAGKADYLLYCLCDPAETRLQCHLLDLPELRRWSVKVFHRYPLHHETRGGDAWGRVVKVKDIEANVAFERFTAPEPAKL